MSVGYLGGKALFQRLQIEVGTTGYIGLIPRSSDISS